MKARTQRTKGGAEGDINAEEKRADDEEGGKGKPHGRDGVPESTRVGWWDLLFSAFLSCCFCFFFVWWSVRLSSVCAAR